MIIRLEVLIPRSGPWSITVADSRDDGTKTPWTLTAQNDGLYNGSTKFNGDVVYKDSNGDEQVLANNVQIATGFKTQTGEQDTSINKKWNATDGLMLQTNGLTTAGNYSGQMNWILSDTI